jgi:predicted dehydrogenase
MSPQITRREFLKTTAAGGLGFLFLKDARSAFGYPANEKLNVAGIGVGGKGHSGVGGCGGENIVALCDVDWNRAAPAFKDWPNARRYYDFRRMLDKMDKEIDAVVVSTPDHTHAPASVMAMEMGKHCYCEKPLTKTVYEARVMRDTARRNKVATQMGNQGTAETGLREAVEIIRAGILGPVREVHVWSNRPVWPQGLERPTDTPPVPKELDWDLWLGPAPKRPYHPAYLPFVWRGWKDFGTGAVGDMGCHTLNLPYMALKLDDPISIEAEVFEMTKETFPKRSIIRYLFPARGELAPVKLTWYDGSLKPPKDVLFGRDLPGSGCVIIGDKARLFAPDDYASHHELLPEDQFTDFKMPPPTLPRSPGHHAEWIRACKGGEPAMSNFDYAAGLTEMALLGNLAILAGEKVYWDPARMKALNCPKADYFINPPYREGWKL